MKKEKEEEKNIKNLVRETQFMNVEFSWHDFKCSLTRISSRISFHSFIHWKPFEKSLERKSLPISIPRHSSTIIVVSVSLSFFHFSIGVYCDCVRPRLKVTHIHMHSWYSNDPLDEELSLDSFFSSRVLRGRYLSMHISGCEFLMRNVPIRLLTARKGQKY